MTMRPDLFDPHTVHWHGFPQAASIFDGVPDASISINMGATLTYYYNAKDAGTYMYHCHVEATEHMQMGMLGNLYVRPRQNKLADAANLFTAFTTNAANVLNGGTTPAPAVNTGALHATATLYAYNDGDGTTRYDVEYPIQIGSFDPDFHDASLERPAAALRRDAGPLLPAERPRLPGHRRSDGALPATRPARWIARLAAGVQPDHGGAGPAHPAAHLQPERHPVLHLGTNGLPMEVVGLDARLLRDGAGNNMYYKTNSLTLGGGQSADVILVAPAAPGHLLPLHHQPRPAGERRRELRRHDDRDTGQLGDRQ